MIMERKINLDPREENEIKEILEVHLGCEDDDSKAENILNALVYFEEKFQEAFDFGYTEGRKELD